MQMANTSVLRSKFLHLKKLIIRPRTVTFSYDYFSLVSLLDACPSLETLILDVSWCSYFCDSNNYHSGNSTTIFNPFLILGIPGENGACLHIHRSLRSEERTAASQDEESEDLRIHICKESCWAYLPFSWEHNITWIPYAGVLSESYKVFCAC